VTQEKWLIRDFKVQVYHAAAPNVLMKHC